MITLLEDKAENVALAQRLERAVVTSAASAEQAAKGCRAIVAGYWRRILLAIQAGGSGPAVVSRFKDAIRGATRDLVAHMDRSFAAAADQSFDLVDRAMFDSIPEKLVKLVEDSVDDYLDVEGDPIENWPAGRRIPPLPPDPGPARKVHYTGKQERKPNKTTATKIIKSGKYRERMERWSKQITDKKAVSDKIANGVAKGRSLQEIAKEVEPHVRNLSSSAMRIVRTETARIHNEVAELNYATYDSITAGYRVINPLDERTRPEHRRRATERNANGLVGRIYWKPDFAPKGATYSTDDRPSLPDAPNCRCSYVPVLIDPDQGVKFGKVPAHVRDKVDDIENDVDEETLEKYRADERKKLGMTEKKDRAGIRARKGEETQAAERNAKIIGTKEWKAARRAAEYRAAVQLQKNPKPPAEIKPTKDTLWEPQKTAVAVRKKLYAEHNLSLIFDSDVDVETLNHIAETHVEMMNAHPGLKRNDSKPTVYAMNRKYVNDGTALGTYEMSLKKMRISSKLPKRRSKLKLGKDVWSIGGGTSADVYRHEWGHHVHYNLRQYGLDPSEVWTLVKSAMKDSSKVTEYAGTNNHELFAEAFAAYVHPDYGQAGVKRLPEALEVIMVKLTGVKK